MLFPLINATRRDLVSPPSAATVRACSSPIAGFLHGVKYQPAKLQRLITTCETLKPLKLIRLHQQHAALVACPQTPDTNCCATWCQHATERDQPYLQAKRYIALPSHVDFQFTMQCQLREGGDKYCRLTRCPVESTIQPHQNPSAMVSSGL